MPTVIKEAHFVIPDRLTRAMRGPMASGIAIEPGSVNDYDALAPFHYRSGRPATCVLVLRATCTRTGELAGVLVVSMPTLNGAWRDSAWPGRFTTGRKCEDAARINEELRTISRVVVDPRYRSCGVASSLVRAYLCRPLTPCTEAVAAMGAISPFFERAGMRPVSVPARPDDQRLMERLRGRGLTLRGLPGLRRVSVGLEADLRRWCRSRRGLRERAGEDARELARLASLWCGSPLYAYAHTRDRRATQS